MSKISNSFELTLNNAYMLNPRVRHLEFKLNNHNELFKFIPGQFISLFFDNHGEIIRRNFSIANSPNENNIIEMAVTFVPNGFASPKLHQMQIGETITAAGPFGIFVLSENLFNSFNRCILVATGTGVTPYRSMLPMIHNLITQKNIEFILLLGVRNNHELLYANDFREFQNKHLHKFKFISCYSRNTEATNASNLDLPETTKIEHYQGYVQKQLSTLNIDPANDLIYLCGNPNMIEDSLKILSVYNLSRQQIKREKYIS